MTKRKLIIHVGMGKTGSSSIQQTFAKNKEFLASNGVAYLGLMMEHLPLPNQYEWRRVMGWVNLIKMPREEADQGLAHMLKIADDRLPKDLHTLVWSNESFFNGP